ncbi:MAG: hypothetical protein ACLFSE_03730 [Spirochaetia bacterium]
MRYTDSGNVHKDFHLAVHRTVSYVLENYGMDFLRELFAGTAHKVYRSIWEDLKCGDPRQLLEHWKHYYAREDGIFDVAGEGDEIIFSVRKCPMIEHLKKNGIPIDETVYLPDILLNEFWSEGTPFSIETEITGEGEYDMIIRREKDASQ